MGYSVAKHYNSNIAGIRVNPKIDGAGTGFVYIIVHSCPVSPSGNFQAWLQALL
jgi:hypothetical protein